MKVETSFVLVYPVAVSSTGKRLYPELATGVAIHQTVEAAQKMRHIVGGIVLATTSDLLKRSLADQEVIPCRFDESAALRGPAMRGKIELITDRSAPAGRRWARNMGFALLGSDWELKVAE